MTTTTPTPFHPDAPAKQMADLVSRQRDLQAAEVLRAELTHEHDEADRIAYVLDLQLIAHPEAVSGPETYPDWSAALEQRIADEKAARARRTA